MSEPNDADNQDLNAFGPLKDGPDHIRRIIEKILSLEQERLYQRAPRLNDDVIRIIKEEVE